MGKCRRRKSMKGGTLGDGGMSEEALFLLNDNLDMVRKNYILPTLIKDYKQIKNPKEDRLSLDRFYRYDPTEGKLTKLLRAMVLSAETSKGLDLHLDLVRMETTRLRKTIKALREKIKEMEQTGSGNMDLEFNIGKLPPILTLTRLGAHNIYLAWYYFYYFRGLPALHHIDIHKYSRIVDMVNAIGVSKNSKTGVSNALMMLATKETAMLEDMM
jgi:hypothetical protein